MSRSQAISLQAIAVVYFAHAKLNSVRARRQLTSAINRLSEHVGHDATTDDLTDANLDDCEFAARLEGRSNATVVTTRNSLRTIWRHAHRLGCVTTLPTDRPHGRPVSKMPTWTRAEVWTLLLGIDQLKGVFHRSGIRRSTFWKAYIMLAIETPATIRELANLTPDDVNHSGELRLRSNSGRVRHCTIAPSTLAVMLPLLGLSRPRVFDVGKTTRFGRLFRAVLNSIGIRGTLGTLFRTAKELRKADVSTLDTSSPIPAEDNNVVTAKHLVPLSADGPQTVREFFDAVYVRRRLVGKARSTIHQYHATIRQLDECLGRPATLADFNDDVANGFLAWRLEQDVSRHTVAKDRSQLLAMSNYAARRRFIEYPLELDTFPVPQDPPQTWTVEELGRLFQSAASMPGMIAGIPAGLWWETLLRLTFETGERAGAILAARWEWLDLEQATFRVPARARKGKCKGMFYRLREPMVEMLRRLKDGQRSLVFPWPFDVSTFYNHWKKLLERAGLPVGRKFKTQCLRRAHASYVEAGGGSGTEALAHSNRSLTLRSYIDPTIANKASPSSLLPLLPSSKPTDESTEGGAP